MANVGTACADQIIMSPKEQALLDRFTASPTQEEVVEAFNSRHYLLHQEAIEWMILNRDTKTWVILKEQKGKLKEISLKLYPILDFLASQPPERDKPLILILKEEHLKMLVKNGEELPPRHEYSYIEPPVDEVLYELLAKDLERIPSSNGQRVEAARLLLQYRAPTKNLEESVKLKATKPHRGHAGVSPY